MSYKGAKGYTIDPKHPSKPYRAQMSVNRATVSLGNHETPEQATAAYLEARAKIPRMSKRPVIRREL